MSLETFGTFLTLRIGRVLGVVFRWKGIAWQYALFLGLMWFVFVTYSHCFCFRAKHTKIRLIRSFLVQFKVSSFCEMTINLIDIINSGFNHSSLFYFGAVEPRPSAQHLPTLPSKMTRMLQLIIQAWHTRASLVPTVTTLADLLSGRRGPSGWFRTVCLARFPCYRRPRWSSYKDIWTNYF